MAARISGKNGGKPLESCPAFKKNPFSCVLVCLRERILELLKEKKAEGSVELESGVEGGSEERKRAEKKGRKFTPF